MTITTQAMKTIQAAEERPTAAFALSVIAGLLILVGTGATMMIGFPLSGGPYYGGMMSGYYGMMGGYYGTMQGLGFGGGWVYGMAALGLISGIMVLIGAVMFYNQLSRTSTWGAVIIAFSIVSLFGMGGFFLGAVLGFIGGILALTWKR